MNIKIVFFVFLFTCFLSLVKAEQPIDGYSLIETNPDIELHHAERAFLLSAACYNTSFHMLSESRDPGESKRKVMSKLVDAEREALEEKKRVINEIRVALSTGGRLFWAQKRDTKERESGYVIVRDGRIAQKWLSDWAVVQKDGSLKTESKTSQRPAPGRTEGRD